MSDTGGGVRRRLVYYISGFDPRGPRFYHQLYKTEALRQQAVDGCTYTVSGRSGEGDLASGWTVHAQNAPSGDTDTRYTFLRWDDIVRDHWPASKWKVIGAMAAFYRTYASHGAFAKTRRAVPRMFWTLMAPAIYGVMLIVLAVGLGALLSGTVQWLGAAAGLPRLLAGLAGAALAGGVLWAGVAHAERMRLFWLMRILGFTHRWAVHGHDPYADRWAAFADRIRADIARHPADEVLLVGHSVGTMAAIAVMDQLLTHPPPGQDRRGNVKLLTLGQVVPLLGLIPAAGWFREQLQRVGDSDVPWLDYTAPGDPLSYVLADPFRMCGLVAPGRANFRIKSSRFDKMFTRERYAPIRKDAFRIHFQYLMASELPVENDFVGMTAGGQCLRV